MLELMKFLPFVETTVVPYASFSYHEDMVSGVLRDCLPFLDKRIQMLDLIGS